MKKIQETGVRGVACYFYLTAEIVCCYYTTSNQEHVEGGTFLDILKSFFRPILFRDVEIYPTFHTQIKISDEKRF